MYQAHQVLNKDGIVRIKKISGLECQRNKFRILSVQNEKRYRQEKNYEQ